MLHARSASIHALNSRARLLYHYRLLARNVLKDRIRNDGLGFDEDPSSPRPRPTSTGAYVGSNLGVNPVRNLGVSTTFDAIPPRGASSTEVAMTPSKWGFCGDSVWDYHTIESSVSSWTLAPIRSDLIWQVLNTAFPVTNPSVQ